MSIFKNPESCPNCIHKDVCMYKKGLCQVRRRFGKRRSAFTGRSGLYRTIGRYL